MSNCSFIFNAAFQCHKKASVIPLIGSLVLLVLKVEKQLNKWMKPWNNIDVTEEPTTTVCFNPVYSEDQLSSTGNCPSQ